ncbi:MAG TPA: hypothetical protein VFH68_10175 [Polyangia bacterium]|nr:hypothetical protein [Polyangia bacterium]
MCDASRATDLGRRRASQVAAAASTLLGLLLGQPGVAHADGAFPNAVTVLLPADHPEQITVAATFGLVFSDDEGAHWRYACESQATTNGRLYTMGPAPNDQMFALSDYGAAVTLDHGCTWKLATGPFDGGRVLDFFPDPIDPSHVLLLAEPPAPAGFAPLALFESRDGGLNYRAPALFTAPADTHFTGVELARADPAVVYLTAFATSPNDTLSHPRLIRSADAGVGWETIDLEPSLGASRVSLAAIDPDDANRVYLRVSGTNAQLRTVDSIAVSTDGGHSFTTPVNLTGGTLTTFFARRDGTVLVNGLLGATLVGYRSIDRGATFSSWRPGVHPKGFGERGGILFVATDNALDDFALASSDDGGDTFTPRMRFDDIEAVSPCVYQACLIDCGRQMALGLFPPAVCRSGDAGVADAGAPTGPKGKGCGACSVAGDDPGGLLAGPAVAFGLLRLRSRSRSRAGRPAPDRRPRPPARGARGSRCRRRGRGRAGWTIGLALAMWAPARPAMAYVRALTEGGVPIRWGRSCIAVQAHLDDLPGLSQEQMRAAVQGATRAWSAAANSCTNLELVVSFSAGAGPLPGSDGVSVMGARREGWCPVGTDPPPATGAPAICNPPSALAATSVFASPTGDIRDSDTELNTLTVDWAALDEAGQPSDRHDLQSALTHEVGHLLGLAHRCYSGVGQRATDDLGVPVPNCYGAPQEILDDTMFPTIEPGDISRRVLSPEAVRALCALYPAPPGYLAPADPPTTCAAPQGGCALSPIGQPDPAALLALSVLLLALARRSRSPEP